MCAECSAESFYTVKDRRSKAHPVLRIRTLLIARSGVSILFLPRGHISTKSCGESYYS